jgi:MYXO-CTERM domain-containing protein
MNAHKHWKVLGLIGGAALGVMGAQIKDAEACGCFTPPDPSVPVVQAGERIAFAMDNGQVTAHIQIQYQGNATDFGWLLPLPSVPTLQLGTDEMFNQLITQTQPKYRLNRTYEGNCSFGGSRFGGGGANAAPSAQGAAGGEGDSVNPPSPLVIQDSIGPYDYAVLHADSQDAMLQWLSDNHYFVPAGTTDSVGAYIRPGAYFLALKLHSGNSAGDLQPVVVKYASDLPMIPLVLTSVGAAPDMGIQVWMLGDGRAIPRNYYHTVLNDAVLDWNTAGSNYNDVVIRATKESVGRHTFVTEYAGTSTIMRNLLNAPGRFGSNAELAAQPDAISFIDYLNQHGFATFSNAQGGGPGGPAFGTNVYPSQLLGILAKYVPVPPALAAKGITPSSFYQSISYYLGSYQTQFPGDFTGYTINYQPAMMAMEIQDRVVQPTLDAGALFDKYNYLTRLYTTLSPENMDKDPVFSFNPGLADYANLHQAELTYHCGFFGRSNQLTTPATLKTADGWVIQYPYGTGSTFTPPALPASERIEILSEEGPPQVVTDNTKTIGSQLGGNGSGCAVGTDSRATETATGVGLLALLGGLLFWRRRRTA